MPVLIKLSLSLNKPISWQQVIPFKLKRLLLGLSAELESKKENSDTSIPVFDLQKTYMRIMFVINGHKELWSNVNHI